MHALLEACLAHATEMLACDAFVHQYEAYGLTKAHFREAFAIVEQVHIDLCGLSHAVCQRCCALADGQELLRVVKTPANYCSPRLAFLNSSKSTQ